MTDQKDKESEPDKEKNPNSSGQKPGKYPKNIYRWVLFFMVGMMLLVMLADMGQQADEITFDEFQLRLENREVESVSVASDHLTGVLKPEAMEGKDPEASNRFTVVLHPGTGKEAWLNDLLTQNGVPYKYETPNTLVQILLSLLPWVLIFGVMYFFIFRQFRGGGGGMLGNFGRSKHRVTTKDQSSVSFDQVAGIEEAKDEVQEIIQFLRSPKKFQRLGGRIPRGILLVGEPGCGKTLLAKAIAGEADVPFFSISGSDFVEMFVGVGAARVRDLFKQAKENSPCIIFLDEIDAVGRKRGSGIAGGGNDEREQTLNAILVEMDGFSTNDQVIVIAATNRADVLDHALIRPGRFDRQIYVPLPDVKGRLEILKVHAKKIKLAPNIDLSRIARGTPMYSGADLEAIINEAALAATMLGKDYVEMDDLEEARDKVRWGRARRSRVVDEKDRVLTAYHEAGHALVQTLLDDTDPVHKVNIISRGSAGGATFSLPEQDRYYYSQNYCLAEIRVMLGGRIAEELFCGDISSGAQSDIKQATSLVKSMIMEWGMSDKLGFIHYGRGDGDWQGNGQVQNNYSDHTAETIDTEIRQMMSQAYEDVKILLSENRQAMEDLKENLIKYETLDGDEVKQIIAGKPLDRPTVLDLLEAEKNRTPDPDEPKEKPTEKKEDQPDNGLGQMPEPKMG